VSDAGEFVDYTLQMESTWEKAAEASERLGGRLKVYGASVGAVRGTIRDTLKRYKNLDHDAVTALSSELWAEPVFERRQAAVVLLQSKVGILVNTDLTRIEGFIRRAGTRELVEPLAEDVVRPLMARLDGLAKERAERVWNAGPQIRIPELRHAAALATGAATP
jgi:hypothetical protein